MEAGTIGAWNFKEGESFNAGDVLAEIETDKATMGFEAQDPGVIAKILVPSGVEVGTCVCLRV
jgi:pyruvate dehydrogenase E2 component (dihydrolipoamide acetyltransferase)